MGQHHHHTHHDHHTPIPSIKGEHSSLKLFITAIILLSVFAVIEALGGWWTGSLALLSDAGHMASDVIALMIGAFASWMATKPRSEKHSYGFGRAEILAAWISSVLLLVIALCVMVEAIARIRTPPHSMDGVSIMVIATAGILVNLGVAWILSRGEQNLNMRVALLHVISDLAASVTALIAGIVIYCTQWILIDAILSIIISVMIAVSSIRLLRESVLILMEGVPRHINYEQVETSMLAIPGIRGIHDLHIWALSSGRIALSAHIDIHDLMQWKDILSQLTEMLGSAYRIYHITLQPEPEVFTCVPCP